VRNYEAVALVIWRRSPVRQRRYRVGRRQTWLSAIGVQVSVASAVAV
jgi:hypothetical protein